MLIWGQGQSPAHRMFIAFLRIYACDPMRDKMVGTLKDAG